MQRVSTTVIAVVGVSARVCAEAVGGDLNARAVLPEAGDEPLQRAVDAWAQARRAHVPYLLHDADPLAAVADAWVRRFDQHGPVGELEVAVGDTVTRWRAGSIELPDYYLVLDGEALEATRRHWYLGFLHGAAPSRVVPSTATPAGVRAAIPRLRAGRWWPDLEELLAGVEHVVPDRA